MSWLCSVLISTFGLSSQVLALLMWITLQTWPPLSGSLPQLSWMGLWWSAVVWLQQLYHHQQITLSGEKLKWPPKDMRCQWLTEMLMLKVRWLLPLCFARPGVQTALLELEFQWDVRKPTMVNYFNFTGTSLPLHSCITWCFTSIAPFHPSKVSIIITRLNKIKSVKRCRDSKKKKNNTKKSSREVA